MTRDPRTYAKVGVLALAAGLTVIRSATGLPRWLGWAGAVIGAVCFVPWGAWIAFLLGGLWIIVAGVLLTWRPAPADGTRPSAAAPPG
ncbi:hypothetical protein [Kitasatospora sp. NPDC002040]|uniref:hypothetical protein n=1 Tax=Kitasatospora sp. NPDC002040 TaxID=3154661 RepID=UPI0033307047